MGLLLEETISQNDIYRAGLTRITSLLYVVLHSVSTIKILLMVIAIETSVV